MSEERTPYGKTYTSFSGADAIPYYAGVVLGEVSDIKWEMNYDPKYNEDTGMFGPVVSGFIEIAVFAFEPKLVELIRKEGRNQEFKIEYRNEYGDAATVRFPGFKINKRVGGLDINSAMETETFYFEAHDVVRTELTPLKRGLDEMIFKTNNVDLETGLPVGDITSGTLFAGDTLEEQLAFNLEEESKDE